ncbi:unnamed protein product [Peronospora belbahrii]|uniref:Uncharacterized protein n=1 Tax=Peronospora belbahrii TaxID=622444 RepID=A0AAU9L847_9STRA|nr:unnamed protein product [Peronospora belbahrii]
MAACRIQQRWRRVAHGRVGAGEGEISDQHEPLTTMRLQSQRGSFGIFREVNEIRESSVFSKDLAELKIVMALKIQCWWRALVRAKGVGTLQQAGHETENEVENALITQTHTSTGRNDVALRRSGTNSCEEESGLENEQLDRQPTLTELQLLSQTGRFSYLSDDSDGNSEFEDAPSFVGEAPFAPSLTESQSSLDNEPFSSPRASHGDFGPRISSSSANMTFEFSISEYHSTFNDDKSDASSDIFVDAMEEHKPIEHNFHNVDADKNRHWTEECNSLVSDLAPSTDTSVSASGAPPPSPIKEEVFEEADNGRPSLSSSISDFDRLSSVRSESFLQELSLDSDTPRGSLASSSLSGVSKPHGESLADPFRSRDDSYADSTRFRGDSYADSTRSRNDSYADVFRSRDNSYDDGFQSHRDSYADTPCKSDYDDENLSDVEKNCEGLKNCDSDSDYASSFISDTSALGQNTSEIEKDEVQDEDQATRNKSSSRWRAASVLSALSSRQSSKPTSSPTSSLEDEEKDETKTRSTTSHAVSSLSSVAGMLTRKLSVSTNNSGITRSFEAEIEDSVVYSPQAQQRAPKSKSRFGRFTAPTVSKPAFPTRFGWKSISRRGANGDDREPGDL